MTDGTTGGLETGEAVGETGEAEVEPVMVVMNFRSTEPDQVLSILAKYVVLSRGQVGCRNIDLVVSVTQPERVVVVEKWDSLDAQREHFASTEMQQTAAALTEFLSEQPDIDLFEGVSMHDLA